MYGLWAYYVVLANYRRAEEQAIEFLRLAKSQKDGAEMVACRSVGWTYVMVGKVSASLPYFERIASQYNLQQQFYLMNLQPLDLWMKPYHLH